MWARGHESFRGINLNKENTVPTGKGSGEQAGDRGGESLHNVNFHQFGGSAKRWNEGGLLLPRPLTFLLTSLISTATASAGE